MIKIFDDIIDKPLQEEIKSTLLRSSGNFPWFFLDDVTSSVSSDTQLRPAFFHLFCDNFQDNSYFYSMTKPIIDNVVDKLKLKLPSIYQSRTIVQLPLSLKNYTVDNAHIDYSKPHLVILYYVMDSDGDTIVYDKKWKEGTMDATTEMTKNMLIKKRITPKQGRVVVFDGHYWHTAEQPKYNNRCIINNNVTYVR